MLRTVLANDLDGAWYETLRTFFIEDPIYYKKYLIDKGSFEKEQIRYQIESLLIQVTNPEIRPLSPIMPGGSSLDPPSTDEYINKYFAEYIMNPEKDFNSDYSYGQFIYPHLDRIIDDLKTNPNNNQMTINIGEPLDHKIPEWFEDDANPGDWGMGFKTGPKVYKYPPCLRVLSWQYNNGIISLHSFWRSWDLWAGMPTNLGGLQLLNEYIAQMSGLETGEMFAYSCGAHIYENCRKLLEGRFMKKL